MQLPPVTVDVKTHIESDVHVNVGGVDMQWPISPVSSIAAAAVAQDPQPEPIYRNPLWELKQSSVPLTETHDWSLEFLGIPKLWGATRGEGIKVCILDTGVDTKHNDLAVADAKDFTNSITGPEDYNSHGTWCCGMMCGIAGNNQGIAGICNKATLYSGKVLGDSGSGTDATIERGMLWAMSLDVDIVSMSLGGGRMSERLHAVFREFVSKPSRFIFAASGNDAGPVNYPGAWPECIAVGAVDRQGNLLPFTSRGPQLAILAPGKDMLSTIPVHMGSYGSMTGTSMATPEAAAIATLALSKHRKHGGESKVNTVDEMRQHLKKTAINKPDGYGLIDPAKFLEGWVPAPVVPVIPDGVKLGPIRIHHPAVLGDDYSFKWEF